MEDFIINKIQEILSSVASAGTGIIVQSPQQFNATIYNGVVNIMENAVMPVAYVILGLLFMLEIYNITIRTDIQGVTGVEIPFKVMFKLAVCKIVVDNSRMLMDAIYSVSAQLITNIGAAFASGAVLTPADINSIKTVIENMDYGVKLMTSIEVLIVWLILKFVLLMVSVIVVGRMVEIYVLMAIAPVPIATFPNAEVNGVAKNFLKAFAAVCLQGALIYIIVSMFSLLYGSVGSISDASKFADSMLAALGYSLVLLISIFASGKWAKSICNAM